MTPTPFSSVSKDNKSQTINNQTLKKTEIIINKAKFQKI